MNLFHIKVPYFYKPGSSITRLMFSRVTRQISGTFMHIFSAVYIYQLLKDLGYTQPESLVFVLIYYFLAFSVKLIVLYQAQYFSSRWGFKNTIRLSVVPYSFYIYLLYISQGSPGIFLAASVFAGINAGLYWWGYHGYFVKNGRKGHFGSTMGEVNVLETAANIITPLAGAFAISLVGFKSLFIISLIFVYLSAVFLGKGSKTRQKHNISFSETAKLIKDHKPASVAYFGLGAESVVASIAWPLFLFLFYGQVMSLGLAITLAAFLASVFSMVIGAKADTNGGISLVKAGSIVLVVTWIIKVFGRSLGIFVLSDSLANFGRHMVSLPLNTLSYRKALESQTSKAILFLETTQLAGTLAMLAVITAIILLGLSLELSFILASFVSLLPLMWAFKKRE